MRMSVTDLPRRFVWLSVAAGGCVIAALTSFPVDLTEDRSGPPLAVNDVEGVWSASSGGRLTVRADGSAELENVPEPGHGCGQAPSAFHTGPATWVFDTYPDESPGIRLDYPGATPGQMCSVHLSISISDEYGTKGGSAARSGDI
ncbi:hypothetical protein DRB96_36585 [Streptomyces sp. ICC1]|nr:hypothetical protein DRB89_35990 [Streptomyces sp. ICC4]AWZ16799.1 hypothetical protein DRB96_36585 [Streptomyces sp. ICC1]